MSTSAPYSIEAQSLASAKRSPLTFPVTNVEDSDSPFKVEMRTQAELAYRDYQARGNLATLEACIHARRVVVDMTPNNSPEKAETLHNLAVSVHARFKRIGELCDLEESISLRQLANALTPDESPDKHRRLCNLAVSLASRFHREGRFEDLEEAIGLETRAIELVADSHKDKPSLLNNLGSSLEARFALSGNPSDFDEAILLKSRAIDLTPDDHPEKLGRLTTLGTSFLERFEQLGNLEDVEKAIALHGQSVELTPDEHPTKYIRLHEAGNSLVTRFLRLGNLEDVSRAIQLIDRALELIPDAHSDKETLHNTLAVALGARFEKTGSMEDLHRAIEHQVRAIDLTPSGHLHRPSQLNNLGTKLQTRFIRSENQDDLNAAITHLADAVKLTPKGDPEKPRRLYNLSNSLETRFKLAGDLSSLEEAIECSAHSVELLPKNHPNRAQYLRALGIRFLTRLGSQHAHADDAAHAIEAFFEAMKHPTSPPLERLKASGLYVEVLTDGRFTASPPLSVIQAWEYAFSLIPQCMWLGNDIHGRLTSEELTAVAEVVNKAATAAIVAGEYGRSLEWLEAGRSVVWSQVVQLRTPIDDLRCVHPQLADNLHHVSQALQQAASPTPSSSAGAQYATAFTGAPTQPESSHMHALEYDKLISHIRTLKGFQDFMRPKTFAQLSAACAAGPVVVINVHYSRCDALVLCCPGHVIHVPLRDFSLSDAVTLQNQLWAFLRNEDLLGRWRGDLQDELEGEERGLKPRGIAKKAPDLMRKLLAMLWTKLVKPIMDTVLTLMPRCMRSNCALPYVTWCPTGPLSFLPLHAAGIYPKDNSDITPVQTMMDIAVSSYTPTLEALLRPRTNIAPGGQSSRVLIVSQPNTPGYKPIRGTIEEVRIMKSQPDLSAASTLHGAQGTVSAVLEGMTTHSWVHLACHGCQDCRNPIKSAFILHDGKLTLEMLMSKQLPRLNPNADLAVLSACQTATGDLKLPEEAVHLAAGMLNIGFKSVVGTMWSIYDSSAPIMFGQFYSLMTDQVERGGELRPAYALHEATKALQARYGIRDFVRWVPFVHFGL